MRASFSLFVVGLVEVNGAAGGVYALGVTTVVEVGGARDGGFGKTAEMFGVLGAHPA